MANPLLSDADCIAAEVTIQSIREENDEPFTNGAFEQLLGATHLGRAMGRVTNFPTGHLIAAAELRGNLVTIMSKIAWMQQRRADGDLDDITWIYFASSDIVAFHMFLRSLLDAIGALSAGVATKKGEIPESFADLRSGLADGSRKEKRIRKHLGDGISEAIRSCDWFEDMRDLRDDLVHRGAQALLFLEPGRVLFQVHIRLDNRIVVPAVMFNENVVDFTTYSALVMARLMVFLDAFAEGVFELVDAAREMRLDNTKSVHSGYLVLRSGLESLLL